MFSKYLMAMHAGGSVMLYCLAFQKHCNSPVPAHLRESQELEVGGKVSRSLLSRNYRSLSSCDVHRVALHVVTCIPAA